MAQADVLTLVADLAGPRMDSVALSESARVSEYYSDVVQEVGLDRVEGSADASFIAVTAGTATAALPTDAIRMLFLAYDDAQLWPTLRRALEASDPAWRVRQGRPISYTAQDEDTRTVRLVPVPDRTGAAIGGSTPFTGTFPDGNLLMAYTATVTDVLAWDEMWVALEILGREFGRESDHFDPEFSKQALQLAQVFRLLVGYAR